MRRSDQADPPDSNADRELIYTIAALSPVPLIITRPDSGEVLYANPPMATMMGTTLERLEDRRTIDFYADPGDRHRVLTELRERGKVTCYEIRLRRLDGTPIWVQLSLTLTKVGGELVVLGGVHDIDARKRAEEALRWERNFASAVLDTVAALVLVLDRDGHIIRFNRTCQQTSGYSLEEVQGHSFELLLDPQERQTVWRYFESLVGGLGASAFENHWIAKDGSRRRISWSNTVMKDDEGHGSFVVATGIDVTAAREADKRLRLYREVFRNTSDAIMVLDKSGHIIERNPAHRRLLDLPDEQIRGKAPHEVIGEEPAALIGHALEQRGLFRGEVSLPGPGQPVMDLSVFAVHDESHQLICYAGIARDISERKKAENLLAQRLRYEEALAQCSALLLTPPDGRDPIDGVLQALRDASQADRVYVFENLQHEQLGLCMRQTHEVCGPGVSAEIGNPELQCLPYEGTFGRWRDALGSGRPVHGVVETFSPAERALLEPQGILSILVLPIFLEHQWVGFIGFDDVHRQRSWSEQEIRMLRTAGEMIGSHLARKQDLQQLRATNRELQQTQTQLVQSEKMAALGQLVAGIAHEINTPLGAINSMHDTLGKSAERLRVMLAADLAAEDGTRPRQLRVALDAITNAHSVICSACDRVTNIVRRLRSFARLDEAELKRVDLHEGIEDTLTIVHHELKHKARVVRQYGDLPLIPCYAGRLNQLFLNVLINASQAISADGEIVIKTMRQGDSAVIEIKDNGCGMDEATRQRIFDPGFTTKGVGVGTGLGLAICYQIAQEHRGTIEVESTPGEGSTFRVRLPLDQPEPPSVRRA